MLLLAPDRARRRSTVLAGYKEVGSALPPQHSVTPGIIGQRGLKKIDQNGSVVAPCGHAFFQAGDFLGERFFLENTFLGKRKTKKIPPIFTTILFWHGLVEVRPMSFVRPTATVTMLPTEVTSGATDADLPPLHSEQRRSSRQRRTLCVVGAALCVAACAALTWDATSPGASVVARRASAGLFKLRERQGLEFLLETGIDSDDRVHPEHARSSLEIAYHEDVRSLRAQTLGMSRLDRGYRNTLHELNSRLNQKHGEQELVTQLRRSTTAQLLARAKRAGFTHGTGRVPIDQDYHVIMSGLGAAVKDRITQHEYTSLEGTLTKSLQGAMPARQQMLVQGPPGEPELAGVGAEPFKLGDAEQAIIALRNQLADAKKDGVSKKMQDEGLRAMQALKDKVRQLAAQQLRNLARGKTNFLAENDDRRAVRFMSSVRPVSSVKSRGRAWRKKTAEDSGKDYRLMFQPVHDVVAAVSKALEHNFVALRPLTRAKTQFLTEDDKKTRRPDASLMSHAAAAVAASPAASSAVSLAAPSVGLYREDETPPSFRGSGGDRQGDDVVDASVESTTHDIVAAVRDALTHNLFGKSHVWEGYGNASDYNASIANRTRIADWTHAGIAGVVLNAVHSIMGGNESLPLNDSEILSKQAEVMKEIMARINKEELKEDPAHPSNIFEIFKSHKLPFTDPKSQFKWIFGRPYAGRGRQHDVAALIFGRRAGDNASTLSPTMQRESTVQALENAAATLGNMSLSDKKMRISAHDIDWVFGRTMRDFNSAKGPAPANATADAETLKRLIDAARNITGLINESASMVEMAKSSVMHSFVPDRAIDVQHAKHSMMSIFHPPKTTRITIEVNKKGKGKVLEDTSEEEDEERGQRTTVKRSGPVHLDIANGLPQRKSAFLKDAKSMSLQGGHLKHLGKLQGGQSQLAGGDEGEETNGSSKEEDSKDDTETKKEDTAIDGWRGLQSFGTWLLVALSLILLILFCTVLGFICFGCLWAWREFQRQDRAWDMIFNKGNDSKAKLKISGQVGQPIPVWNEGSGYEKFVGTKGSGNGAAAGGGGGGGGGAGGRGGGGGINRRSDTQMAR